MNNIHCSVWNAALGAWVAVSELSRRRGRRPSAARVAVGLLALAGLMAGADGAWAQASGGAAPVAGGGTGGRGGNGNGFGGGGGYAATDPVGNGQPGMDGAGGRGGNGASGIGGAGGAAGATTVGTGLIAGQSGVDGLSDPDPFYGAGGGGGGGAAVYTTNAAIDVTAATTLQGGKGGDGAAARLSGGGGGGGAGLQAVAPGLVLNNASNGITGGNGGNGANGQWASGGGGGGDGIVLQGGGATISNSGTATGGNGGSAIWGGFGFAAVGGEGGAGLALESGGNTLTNTGTLAGGAGGASTGLNGIGGAGLRIRGDANTVFNSGALAGGIAGDAFTRGDAVRITGNDNTLELRPGSAIVGALVANGTGNLLRLTGDTTNITTSLAADTYRGFAGYEKTGSNTWTLTGATAQLTPWRVLGGALSIADDGALGSPDGALALDGGTLNVTGDTAGTRAVTLGKAGGVFDIGLVRTFALNGVVSGPGGLRKTGAGTLSLGATNSYAGATDVAAGTLQALATGALGTGPVSVAGNASLVFGNAADAGSLAITAAERGGAPTDNAGFVQFRDDSSAGGAHITANNDAVVEFRDRATAGNAIIDNRGGLTNIWFNATAGNAQITNHADGQINLLDDASAGQARFVNESGGLIDIFDRASADQATVVNNAGARLRISNLTNAGISIGSLEGAGSVLLGGKALSIGALDTSTTVSGEISGTGGSIVKVGSGTLTLTGANTYTGGTTVATGTLSVNNTSGSATGTGAVQVQSGATLAGSGTIAGDVSIAKGGILAAGNSPGTLTLGSLSLAEGAVMNYELGQAGVPGGVLNDLINVNGNLQLDGTLNVAQSARGTFGAGVYRLMNYTGTLTDNGLDIGSAPAAAKDLQVQTSVARQVNLVNRAGLSLNFWDGSDSTKYNDGNVAGGSGTWRVGSPGDGWTAADGSINAAWAQDQFAVFGGQAGTVTVDGGKGAPRITGAQFATDGYLLQGDAVELGAAGTVVRVGDGTAAGAGMTATLDVALIGAGGLVKDDAGRLVLNGANTYTGGTTVKAGVLQGNATSLQGNIVDNAEVAFDQAKASTGHYAGTLSGSGRLRTMGAGTLVLDSANSYTGGTFVDAGTLATDTSGALGSGPVSVAADAALQFGGEADAGKLSIALAKSGSAVGSTGGSLRFADSSSAGSAAIDNQGGSVRLQDSASAGTASIANGKGGVLAFAGQATADRASVDNQAGAQLRIDETLTGTSIGALGGAGDIVLGGKTLTTGGLGRDTTLSGTISGVGGALVKVGAGTLTLAGSASHSGATRVAEGSLKAGVADALSPASAVRVDAGATLDLAGFDQRVAGLDNAGIVSLRGSIPGTTLTVTDAYVGNGGVLRMAARLDEPGIADRLVLDGPAASASGHTTLQVTNLGGLGARTSGAGIEVVGARNGATTTAQTSQDAFVLAGGHVDAGAYEYRLHAGDDQGEGENWYLRTDPGPAGSAAPSLPAYRAEVPLFAALPSQLRQADLGMLGNLRQRIGDDDMRGSAGTSQSADGGHRRAWGRLVSTDMDVRQGGTVSPRSQGRLTGLQAGTDLLATPDWRAGLYVGQLEGDARVSGFASGIANLGVGRNDLRSQYLGFYGTYANAGGFYADVVLQAGRHRYTVQPSLVAGASGKGNSLLASVEIGQAFAIGAGGWSVEPQLQLIHQRMRLDDAAIPGAIVQQEADSGWIARAGVRVKGSVATGAGTLQPYGRLNVYRSSKGTDVASFVNPAAITPIASPTGGTSTELAAGFTLALGPRTSLYGELGRLWASGGRARTGSGINAGLGVRVKW